MLLAARLWIWLSAILVAGGWLMSAAHHLEPAGYLAVFLIVAGVGFWDFRRLAAASPARALFRRPSLARFRRPLPLLFLVTVGLNLLRGLANPTPNYDSDTYRIPRVFNWLWNHGWTWITTADTRMNIAGCVYEWLEAPLLLLTRTDRWLFVINLLSYMLLPGLIFFVLRRMGVVARVAWWWCWILAGGGCFIFQACSTVNDSLGAVYVLAALAFAFRAAETGAVADLWLSLLAAALLTGIKQSNLPLLLPWVAAIWPARRLALRYWPGTLVVASVAALCSVLVISYLNWRYTGDWKGFSASANGEHYVWGSHQQLTNPFWGLIGNAFAFPVQNLLPPVFPAYQRWNAAMQQFLQTPFGSHFTQFESFGLLDRATTEGNTGIGLSVCFLLVVSCFAAKWWANRLPPRPGGWTWGQKLICVLPWLALLAFLAKVGTYQNARQAAPYYVPLFPLILGMAGHARLVRTTWWQRLVLLVMVLVTVHLTIIRGRACLPGDVVINYADAHPQSRAATFFADYFRSIRSCQLSRNLLNSPGLAEQRAVGVVTLMSAAEPGWWVPFGCRHIVRFLPGTARDEILRQGIRYVIVCTSAFDTDRPDITAWCHAYRATLVKSLTFTTRPDEPLDHLYVVRLEEN